MLERQQTRPAPNAAAAWSAAATKRAKMAVDEAGVEASRPKLRPNGKAPRERPDWCAGRRPRFRASAAASRSSAASRRRRMRDHLGDHRIVERRDRARPARTPVSMRSLRVRKLQRQQRAGRRQEAARRILGIEPRLDRMAVRCGIASCVSGSGSPAATRNCHSTRSSPVIASVTGCSTCSRVFISMNQKPSAAGPSTPSAMNSTVPAPT